MQKTKMTLVHSLRLIATSAAILFACGASPTLSSDAVRPNIILIFTDDQGYQDLGCFGSPKIKTPHLDQMATEGVRLTSFYAQPVCGVSRAALMTGCYPIRVAEPGNIKRLHTVPHTDEITMAEVLRSAGYATGLIGKWHLAQSGKGPGGFDAATMPIAQGFDYFYGTPEFNGFTVHVEDTNMRSPILRNDEVVVKAVESWDHITADYTREAIRWIQQNESGPFFLYLAHNLPHIPVGASDNFKGKSAGGPYGDTIEEIDWSSGEILKTLKELGIDDNTLVVFTSDNGPWIETTRGMKPNAATFIPRDHSGNVEPLRGWKMSAWEGGSRVPFIARWPGKIPAGWESDELLTTMDLLPTFASIAGATMPEVVVDGCDATDFLMRRSPESPRDEYFYYCGCLLTGVRAGAFKLVLPRPESPPGLGWWGRMIEAVAEPQLYDLDHDPGETTNIAAAHPDVVEALTNRIERARAELGDIDQTGSGARLFDEGPRRLQVPLKQPDDINRQPIAATKYDEFEPLGDLRFTFESGKLEPWTIVEGETDQAVSDRVSLPNWKHKPFNHEGRYHLSTLNRGGKTSDEHRLVLQSPEFVIQGDRASFLVSGGFVPDSLFVGLFHNTTNEVLLQAGGSNGPQMSRIIWDVSNWNGETVYLRVVDQNNGNWGHLTFDDFSVDATTTNDVPIH